MNKALRLLAALILSGQFIQAFAGDFQERFAALQRAASEKKFEIVGLDIMEIPGAGNFLSNRLAVAALRAGTDNVASQKIAQLLLQQAPTRLVITGEDDAIGAATLERAFANLKGKSLASHQLIFIGAKEDEEPLSKAAADLGLTLVYVPYP